MKGRNNRGIINGSSNYANHKEGDKMKGCGKEFLDEFLDRRVCGHFEDLKHSDHFIYCPECSQKTSKENKNG